MRSEPCLVCRGSGRREADEGCPYCGGKGRIPVAASGERTVWLQTGSCKVPAKKVKWASPGGAEAPHPPKEGP